MIIKHIFFDLDHTLWDFETNSAKTFDFIFKDNNIDVNLDDFLEQYVPINHQYWKLYREEKVTKSVLRYKRLKDSFDAMNHEISDALINHLATVYIDNLVNYNTLFDGTLELLNYLSLKYQMHIITNGFEEIQIKKMKASGILHFFDQIITSESVGVKKPNPKIFNHALYLAEANVEHSIMIGDNLEADILGAQQVGLKTIFFNIHNTSETFPENFKPIIVDKLIEIKQYL
ncbi:MAG TPA: noncanonical pyrimidine nucleotidase, YjjG family [Flavobacteriaceae bacterium]|jgi:putative hydrolase of the HAD superfamily|nr:noncanonical pyrimidine nucleotidase, YjjG family [Flavobacteriaceae bacterium]HBS12203.1 noncanonical pyrimidine nucleotidase, YjjG family [Flavobacteriaceae bacterium]